MAKKNCELVESIIRGLVKGGVSAKDIMVGVHNSFAFAEIFTETGVTVKNQDFQDFMDSLGEAIELSKRFK